MACTMSSATFTARPLSPARAGAQPLRGLAVTPALPRAKRAAISTRASAVEFVQIAEEAATKVGDVAAPTWVLPLGVVVVTLGSILSGYLLKPGADASDDIKTRDARSGRFGPSQKK